jgi:pimeloyl-ACP methyl ester carboxylesterase
MQSIEADRFAYLTQFFQNFYSLDAMLGQRISDEVVRAHWNIAAGASLAATVACVPTWLTDFREELARVEVPSLILHGDDDRILPLAITGKRLHEVVKGSHLVVLSDGPHGVLWTHADEVNRALLDFLA